MRGSPRRNEAPVAPFLGSPAFAPDRTVARRGCAADMDADPTARLRSPGPPRGSPHLIHLLAVIVSLGFAPPCPAQDPWGAPGSSGAPTSETARAFVELEAGGDTFHWREPIRVTVRFGLDTEFFAEQALPLFLQDFDLPVQLEVPWRGGLPAVADLGPVAPTDARADAPAIATGEPAAVRLALGDGPVWARPVGTRDVGGRRHDLYEVAFDIVPSRSGTLTLPAPSLRYAWTTGFRDDLLADRVPLDHHEALVIGPERALTILPLPEDGRPPAFVDAVGPLSPPTLAVEPRALSVGQVVTLRLTLTGRGVLDGFTPPDLERLPGFHFLSLELRPPADVPATSRTVVYELSPANPGVDEVPALEFAWFDTTPPAGYRVARTEPVPLQVTPRADAPAETPSARTAPGADPSPTAGDRATASRDDGPTLRAPRWDRMGDDGQRLPPPPPPATPVMEPKGNVALLVGLGLAILAPAVFAGVTLIRRHRARRQAS